MSSGEIKLATFEQIEFTKPYHILFKFFVMQKRIGAQMVKELRLTYPNKTDAEIVNKIIETLNTSNPIEYFIDLFHWRTKNDIQYWSRISRFWELFYLFHRVYSQIRTSKGK